MFLDCLVHNWHITLTFLTIIIPAASNSIYYIHKPDSAELDIYVNHICTVI